MKVRNFEILASEETPLGLIYLRRRALLSRPGTVVTEITLNHEFLMSSYLTDSERALARYALEMHAARPRPTAVANGHDDVVPHGNGVPAKGLDVLVGGLGLGYTANEVLVAGGDRVARVEVVEYLKVVIDWLEQDLVPLSGALKGDRRIHVVEGDVYARLLQPPTQKYDLILIDVDHSPDERLGTTNATFYRESGLRLAREHLAEGGVLGVWSYAESSPFADALREVFSEVRLEPVTVRNDLIDEEQTDWLFFARG